MEPITESTTGASSPTSPPRRMLGRRIALVTTASVLAVGVGGIAYAATTETPSPTESSSTPDATTPDGSTTPDDGTTAPDGSTTAPDGQVAPPDGRGGPGDAPCDDVPSDSSDGSSGTESTPDAEGSFFRA